MGRPWEAHLPAATLAADGDRGTGREARNLDAPYGPQTNREIVGEPWKACLRISWLACSPRRASGSAAPHAPLPPSATGATALRQASHGWPLAPAHRLSAFLQPTWCILPPHLCFHLLLGQVIYSTALCRLWLLPGTVGPHTLIASNAGHASPLG